MPANFESVENAVKDIQTTKVVACPLVPALIAGSDTATALESGDTLGLVFPLSVPKSGVIISATLYDFDDKGITTDLMIYSARIADQATDAAYAPTDIEGLNFITCLTFAVPIDHGNFQTFELTNIGKAYSIPQGIFFCQAVTRGTPTVTAGSPYRVKLQIQSFDPSFKEV
jgi:hypothetical protein